MLEREMKGSGIRGRREGRVKKGSFIGKGMCNGKIEWYGEGTWKKGRCNGETMACALCGRRIRRGDAMERALFRAQRGVYLQAFHESCALIRRSNGEKTEFSSPALARAWAKENGCRKCRDNKSCPFNPFDCERAQNVLRLTGDPFGPAAEEDEA